MAIKTKGLKTQAKKMAPPSRKEFDALKTSFETRLNAVQTSLAQAEQRATAAESLVASAGPSQVDVDGIREGVITETVNRLKSNVDKRVEAKLEELGVSREEFNSLVEQVATKADLDGIVEEISPILEEVENNRPKMEFVEHMMTNSAHISLMNAAFDEMEMNEDKIFSNVVDAVVQIDPAESKFALQALIGSLGKQVSQLESEIEAQSETDSEQSDSQEELPILKDKLAKAESVFSKWDSVLSAALPALMDEAVSHEDADDRFDAVDALTDSYETSDVIKELKKIAAGPDPEKAENAQELLNGIETDE
jgi:hypothetical protein